MEHLSLSMPAAALLLSRHHQGPTTPDDKEQLTSSVIGNLLRGGRRYQSTLARKGRQDLYPLGQKRTGIDSPRRRQVRKRPPPVWVATPHSWPMTIKMSIKLKHQYNKQSTGPRPDLIIRGEPES